MRTKSSVTKIRIIFLLAVIIVGLFNEVFGQTRDEKITRARRELAAQAETYLTEFNGMRVNFVNPRVQSFLSERMDLVAVGHPETNFSDGTVIITEVYKKKVHANDKQDLKLFVTYKAIPEGNEFIIQSSQISGYDLYVTEFFIRYWKTTLNFEDVKKQEIVTNYWITDRASLSADAKKGMVIEIVKN